MDAQKIHLWTFNNPFSGISDQIEFFSMIMKQNSYEVTVGNDPILNGVNFVIENFNETTSCVLKDFHAVTGKKVGLIMTEHLDLVSGKLLIHGDPLWDENDYMRPYVQATRLQYLMNNIDCYKAIFILGDLPELLGSRKLFGGLPLFKIPFPKIDLVDIGEEKPVFDLVFSGNRTKFRKKELRMLSKYANLHVNKRSLPHEDRDELNKKAKLVLNLPQRTDWRWLSSMRIMAGLRVGRASISLGTSDKSYISMCCFQISNSNPQSEVVGLIDKWDKLYIQCIKNYETLRLSFLSNHPFPADFIEKWLMHEVI